MIRALLGLDQQRFESLVAQNVTTEALRQPDVRLRAAASWLAAVTSPAALSDSAKVAFRQALSDSLKGDLRDIDVFPLSTAINSIAGAMSEGDPDALKWMALLRNAMVKYGGDFKDFPPPRLLNALPVLRRTYARLAEKVRLSDPGAADERAAVRMSAVASKVLVRQQALGAAYAVLNRRLGGDDDRLSDILTVFRAELTDSWLVLLRHKFLRCDRAGIAL
jgi:hypothetical protein